MSNINDWGTCCKNYQISSKIRIIPRPLTYSILHIFLLILAIYSYSAVIQWIELLSDCPLNCCSPHKRSVLSVLSLCVR